MARQISGSSSIAPSYTIQTEGSMHLGPEVLAPLIAARRPEMNGALNRGHLQLRLRSFHQARYLLVSAFLPVRALPRRVLPIPTAGLLFRGHAAGSMHSGPSFFGLLTTVRTG